MTTSSTTTISESRDRWPDISEEDRNFDSMPDSGSKIDKDKN